MSQRIQFSQHGGPEVLELVEAPLREPGAGEVRVRNHAVGLNFIDTYFRSGLYAPPSLPSGLGMEGAGVIEAVGEGVSAFQPGDRVAYATGPLGAYGEHHTLPARHLVKLPESIGFEQAAAVMLKGLTTQYLLRQIHPLQAGETVLFHAAAGGVGSIACQWAKALGARLIGVVGSPEKAERAKALGAWATIDRSREDVVQRVLELTDGKKCPVVYDSVGKDTWEVSLDCVAPRGLLVSFGNASGAVSGVNLGVLAQKGSLFVTRPVLAGYADTPERLQAMADELFEMIASGRIQVEIGQRYSLGEAAEAQRKLAGRETTGSTILVP
ncbi:quinone oxidoreductase family protein [Pseudomonas lopnurensis]|uniref:quinone oxidoreductase family protein n=1 Tax=Pseudomonas lopnurensis TaxID=1477517 RepID=UPI0028A8250C|nr:quinone oxidoreductase [Pseudomonas lopnurensis]